MRSFSKLLALLSLALATLFAGSASAQTAGGFGLVVTGPIVLGQAFCRSSPSSCVGLPGSTSTISNGSAADQYLLQPGAPPFVNPVNSPSTPSYIDSTSSPAQVFLTTAPVQLVRFFAGTSTLGNFLVGSNEVRGLTPQQLKDWLALPTLPTMQQIVQVPTGSCLLVGTAGPILNSQVSPTGVWGHGGAVQEFIIGKSANPGCGLGAQPMFISTSSYINAQPILGYALAYAPRAGGGNPGAVATALDHALPPPLFSDMGSVYNALDLLNIGSPEPLRSALAQLDGEIYADVSSVSIGVGRMFVDVMRDQTHLAQSSITLGGGEGLRPWVTGFGGAGALSGNGDAHSVSFGGGGVAAGADYRFSPNLRAGVALGHMQSSLSTNGISGSGGMDSFAAGTYAGYAVGLWYFDGELGYSHNSSGISRSIVFPGVVRSASAGVEDHAFLSGVETGFHLQLADRMRATPIASFQGVVVVQNGFAEAGAGAINLNVNSATTALAQSILGAELAYDLPVGLALPLNFSARAGWAHDFADVNRSFTADFQGAPVAGLIVNNAHWPGDAAASFTVNGARWPREAAVAGLRVSLPVQGANLFARYDGMLANNAAIHSATAGLQIAF